MRNGIWPLRKASVTASADLFEGAALLALLAGAGLLALLAGAALMAGTERDGGPQFQTGLGPSSDSSSLE